MIQNSDRIEQFDDDINKIEELSHLLDEIVILHDDRGSDPASLKR